MSLVKAQYAFGKSTVWCLVKAQYDLVKAQYDLVKSTV
jgi:hypothetical protein